MWVVSCELIIRLWWGSRTSLHYIESELSVYVISRLHGKQSKINKAIWLFSTYDIQLRATVKFPVIQMEMNWENMQACMQMYSNLQVTEWLFYRFWEIPRQETSVESYFGRVTIGLPILFKKDDTTGVLVKTFQTFQNKHFLCNI